MRVLMVPPRFGEGMVGGAENLVRGLALRASTAGVDVEVATTCAVDNQDWLNTLPAGESHEDGLVVRRFEVERRNARRHRFLHQELMRTGRLSTLQEADLMGTSVWSSGLQRFLDTEGPSYDAIVFAPYLFGTTFWGLQSWPQRSVVIPCLHDEPYAHLPSMRRVLGSAALRMYNAPGEQALGQRVLGDLPSTVVGLGFDPPESAAPDDFAQRFGLGRFFIYAGRLEEGKRVHIAARYFADFARQHDPSMRLVLIGRGPWKAEGEVARFIRHVGFLSEEDKRSAMAGAVALINPSEAESLSIVLLEAWREGTPALVAHGSEVMREHCRISGGGETFSGSRDFARHAAALLDDPATAQSMGDRGREYVLSQYGWPSVMERFLTGLEAVRRANRVGGTE